MLVFPFLGCKLLDLKMGVAGIFQTLTCRSLDSSIRGKHQMLSSDDIKFIYLSMLVNPVLLCVPGGAGKGSVLTKFLEETSGSLNAGVTMPVRISSRKIMSPVF